MPVNDWEPPSTSHHPPSTAFYSSLTVIGQFQAAYLLCQGEGELVVIDQHAAHERVAYEGLKAQFAAGSVEGQGLLFPESLDFSHAETALLAARQGELASLGFNLEPFGGTTWLLKGVPRILAGSDYLRTLRDLVAELQGLGSRGTFRDAVEELLATIACHSVVRGRHSLTPPEIRELLAALDRIDFAGHCPHGRPVSRTISLGEVEKMFKR